MLTDKMIGNKPGAVMGITDVQVDSIALKVLKRDTPEFILPLNVINIDGEYELRYELVGNRLSYFGGKMLKKDYVSLLKSMLLPYKECVEWFLDFHNLYLDHQYIMYDKNNFSIKYLYIPSNDIVHTDDEINKFFQNLVVNIEVTDDTSFPMKLLRTLMSQHATPVELLEIIMQQDVTPAMNIENNNTFTEVKEENSILNQGIEKVGNIVESALNLKEEIQKTDISKAFEKKDSKVKSNEEKNSFGLFGGLKKNTVNSAKEQIETADIFNKTEDKAILKKEQEIAARPGATFGKVEIGSDIVGNLFGEESKKEELSSKKKEKQPKQPKKVKESKEGGLFGNLFGNKKVEVPQKKNEDIIHYAQDQELKENILTSSSKSGMPEVDFNLYSQSPYEDYEEGTDETITCEDEDMLFDEECVRFKLEDAAGFKVPPYIEIDIRKGYATVGRTDKSGRDQCDYNFDSSISYISRVHFRLEKREDRIYIIDLNSSNGTLVNGRPIVANIPVPIGKGDLIALSARRRITYTML